MNSIKYLIILAFITTIISCTNTKKEIRDELNKGKELLLASNPNQSIIHYNKVLSLDSLNSEAYLNLANCYKAKNNYKKAISLLDKCISKNPNYGQAYRSRAQAYFILGDKSASCSDYLKAQELGVPNLNNYTRNCK